MDTPTLNGLLVHPSLSVSIINAKFDPIPGSGITGGMTDLPLAECTPKAVFGNTRSTCSCRLPFADMPKADSAGMMPAMNIPKAGFFRNRRASRVLWRTARRAIAKSGPSVVWADVLMATASDDAQRDIAWRTRLAVT